MTPLAGIDMEAEKVLRELLAQAQLPPAELPYTEAFERLRQAFVSRTSSEINRHDLWLTVLRIGSASSAPAMKVTPLPAQLPKASQPPVADSHNAPGTPYLWPHLSR